MSARRNNASRRPAGAPRGLLDVVVCVRVQYPRFLAPTDDATARRNVVDDVRDAIAAYQCTVDQRSPFAKAAITAKETTMQTSTPTQPLDHAFLAIVRPAIMSTWNYIGSDSEQLAHECGERLTNEAALEGCIDANRLASFAGENGKRADVLVTNAIDVHGYQKVMAYLKRHVRLV
jgi:hypothetical protein